MVDRQLAFSILQLVALSLPAFAILLQMVVESDMAYTHWAVPLTTGGLGMFLVAGGLILVELILITPSFIANMSMGILLVGMVCLLLGASLIGLQTRRKQRHIRNGDDE